MAETKKANLYQVGLMLLGSLFGGKSVQATQLTQAAPQSIKQAYQFNDYGKYLGEKGAKQWKQGKPIESLLTGLGSWLALGNDCLKYITKPIIGTAGGVSRTIEEARLIEKGSGILGGISGTIEGVIVQNKNNFKKGYNKTFNQFKNKPQSKNAFKKGYEDTENINEFFWRNWWGGANWNKTHAKILSLASLDLLDFNTKKDPYVRDDGIAGAGLIIGSDIAAGAIINCVSKGGNGAKPTAPAGPGSTPSDPF